jgi:hypothetical protein
MKKSKKQAARLRGRQYSWEQLVASSKLDAKAFKRPGSNKK